MIFIVIWWLIGVAGFVYWWTHDYDLTGGIAIFAIFIGVSGPFSWVSGYIIHRDESRKPLVLVRKR